MNELSYRRVRLKLEFSKFDELYFCPSRAVIQIYTPQYPLTCVLELVSRLLGRLVVRVAHRPSFGEIGRNLK
jgi:hypothetical protein